MADSNVSIGLVLRGLTGISLLLASTACIFSALFAIGEFGKAENVGWYVLGLIAAALILMTAAVAVYPEMAD